jgi:hypothetical protein
MYTQNTSKVTPAQEATPERKKQEKAGRAAHMGCQASAMNLASLLLRQGRDAEACEWYAKYKHLPFARERLRALRDALGTRMDVEEVLHQSYRFTCDTHR